MKTSLKAQDIMKKMESLSLKPYDDQKGIKSAPIKEYTLGATIGFGHLIKPQEWSKYKNPITEQEANFLFEQDLMPFEIGVTKVLAHPNTLNQYQFDALVMLAFNIGLGAFQTSSVLKMVNGSKGNYPTLEKSWLAFNKSQGKVMAGLTKRRQLEYDLYKTGVYKYFK